MLHKRLSYGRYRTVKTFLCVLWSVGLLDAILGDVAGMLGAKGAAMLTADRSVHTAYIRQSGLSYSAHKTVKTVLCVLWSVDLLGEILGDVAGMLGSKGTAMLEADRSFHAAYIRQS